MLDIKTGTLYHPDRMQHLSRPIRTAILALILTAGTHVTSCADVDQTSPQCADCIQEPDKELWSCYGGILNLLKGTVCIAADSSESTALSACNSHWSTDKVELIPCLGGGTSASQSDCEDWDPGGAIAAVGTNHYEVDEDFIEYLLADPSRAVNCDQGQFEWDDIEQSFYVRNADTGSLLWEVGLRNGDVVEKINTNDVDNQYGSLTDALSVFGDLYLTQHETEYILEVQRGQDQVDIQIDIVSP